MGRLFGSVLALLVLAAPGARAHDWNDTGVHWRPFDAGLAEAKKAKKPVCLVVFTEWCPHCANYAKVFHDAKVVERSRSFVMIHVDKDQAADQSRRYAPDGEYIPRTMFLDAKGTLDPEIHAPRDRYKFFFDESNPASVLAAMDVALGKRR